MAEVSRKNEQRINILWISFDGERKWKNLKSELVHRSACGFIGVFGYAIPTIIGRNLKVLLCISRTDLDRNFKTSTSVNAGIDAPRGPSITPINAINCGTARKCLFFLSRGQIARLSESARPARREKRPTRTAFLRFFRKHYSIGLSIGAAESAQSTSRRRWRCEGGEKITNQLYTSGCRTR